MVNQKYDSVEDLLKALKRPATAYEIVIAMKDTKERRSVFSEIKTLLKSGALKKLSIPVSGYDGEMTLYLRKVKK